MSSIETKPFIDDGKSAVHGLRRALATMLQSVGASAEEPQEIARRFGLDKTLTWRIARVVREEDVWEAVQHIPRRPSIQLFVTAMTKHGASNQSAELVYDALDQFEEFVLRHSGDRETLEMMAGPSARRSSDKRMEAFRKTGYEANSAIWGVRAKMQLATKFVVPGTDPGMLSLGTVCGLVDFRRLRPETRWAVASVYSWGGENSEHQELTGVIQPMHKDSPRNARGLATPESLLLGQFCTTPLPDMQIIEQPARTYRYMLTEGPVGNTAAATMLLGFKSPNTASDRPSYAGEVGNHLVSLSTPCEELLHDVFIHKSLAFAMNPTAHVFSQMPGGPQFPNDGGTASGLPVPQEVVDLGGGEADPDIMIAEIPNYLEILHMATDSMGPPLKDFRAFRYRLRYPPIPTLAIMRHALRRD